MKNLTFTPPADQKIKDGDKWMTARFWKQNAPTLSEHFWASTGRYEKNRFAELKIVGAYVWNPLEDTDAEIEERIGMSLSEIAKAEGFERWTDFIETYKDLNKHILNDDERTHYLIEFEVVRLLDSPQLELF